MDRLFSMYSQCSLFSEYICEFCCMLNIFVTPKSIFMAHSWSFTGMCGAGKMWVTQCSCSQHRSKKHTLLPCFSSHSVNKYLFHVLCSVMVFAFLCFWYQFCCLNDSWRTFSDLSTRWKRKYMYEISFVEAWIAVLCTLSVCESTIYLKMSLNRNTRKTRLCIDWLMKILWPEACRNLTW